MCVVWWGPRCQGQRYNFCCCSSSSSISSLKAASAPVFSVQGPSALGALVVEFSGLVSLPSSTSPSDVMDGRPPAITLSFSGLSSSSVSVSGSSGGSWAHVSPSTSGLFSRASAGSHSVSSFSSRVSPADYSVASSDIAVPVIPPCSSGAAAG